MPFAFPAVLLKGPHAVLLYVSLPSMQAADRVYYLYQALCDCKQALDGQTSPEQVNTAVLNSLGSIQNQLCDRRQTRLSWFDSRDLAVEVPSSLKLKFCDRSAGTSSSSQANLMKWVIDWRIYACRVLGNQQKT